MKSFTRDRVQSEIAHAPQPAALTTPAMPGRAKQWFDKQAAELDSRADGWDSEAFSELASGVLDQLAEILTDGHPLSEERLRDLVADGFRCTSLKPE